MSWFRRTQSTQPTRSQSPLRLESLDDRIVPTVTYYQGQLLENVQAQAVYYGSGWSSPSSLPDISNPPTTAAIDASLNALVTGNYMKAMSIYNVGPGTSTTGVIDTSQLTTNSTITDASIQARLNADINSGLVQALTPETLYVIYVQPDVAVSAGGATSTDGLYGYHTAFLYQTAGGVQTGQIVRYAVVAYPGGSVGNASLPSQTGVVASLDQLTAIASVVVANAVTDPDATLVTSPPTQYNHGWYDPKYEEDIGNITFETYLGEIGQTGPIEYNPFTRLDGYLVVEVATQNDGPLIISNSGYTPQNLLSGNNWTSITSVASAATAAAGNGWVVSASSGYDLQVSYDGGGYESLFTPTETVNGTTSPITATAVAINAEGDIAAYFPTPSQGTSQGAGLYEYTFANGSYTYSLIYSYEPSVTAVGIDFSGRVVANFTGYGLQRYTPQANSPQSGWRYFGFSGNPNDGAGTPNAIALAVNEAGNVAASFSGVGVYLFTNLTQYTQLYTYNPANGSNVNLIGIDANNDVVGNFTGYGVQELDSGSSAWNPFGGPQAVDLDMNANGQVVIVAAQVSGSAIYVWSPGTGWSNSVDPGLLGSGVVPSAVVIDGNGSIYGTFGSYGYWSHNNQYVPQEG